MPLVFVETAESRKITQGVDSSELRREWVAWRNLSDVVIKAALLSTAGSSYNGLPLANIDAQHKGGGVWMCEALYSLRVPESPANQDDDEALGTSYAVDLTAGQTHITQSLRTVSSIAAGINLTMHPSIAARARPEGTLTPSTEDIGKTVTVVAGGSINWNPGTYTITGIDQGWWVLSGSPGPAGQTGGHFRTTAVPNYRQAIGVTKDSVLGTDVFTAKFEFSVTIKTYPVRLSDFRTFRSIVGKTNDQAWKGFEAGELLYMGLTGQCEPDSFWTLTHKFAAGENKTGLVVSPEITLDKKAWEYLWCTYQQAMVNGIALQVPRAAYVEQVYHEADYNLLRLNPPIASFTSDIIGGMHPLTVNFTDTSTGTPLTWLWTFGDGTSSALRNPIKTYTIPGTYTVSLTVTNGAGQSFKTVTNYITVS